MKKFGAFILGLTFLWSAGAQAQTAAEIKKVENYLNSVKTMEARFVQSASNGNTAEGKFYIEKPNKIRMEYDAPTSVLIVGDGNFIVYYDKDLDQVTHIDYDDIPASLILANDVKIDNKKVKISNYYKDAGITSMTLNYAEKGDVGPISLTFSNEPFELKQWKIVDPQSVEVTVSLYDAMRDESIKESLFKFKKGSSPLDYKKGKKK